VRIVGYVFLALIAAVVALASAFVVATLPDFARYRRMRRM
jgi:hypothetical protein